MSFSKKWLEELEARFGITPEVAGHLRPVLERLAAQPLSGPDRESMLQGVAAAVQSARGQAEPTLPTLRTPSEVNGLLDQFTSELQKMDETLKVLSVYLERLNERLIEGDEVRVLH